MSEQNNAGLDVDIVASGLSRVQRLLSGVPGGAKKAIGSALKRAGSAGNTEAKSAVSREYRISSSDFLANTRSGTRVVQTDDGLTVELSYAGNVIPLLTFGASYGRGGHIAAAVKRESTRTALDKAFVARVGGHRGIFERTGAGRFPIKELFGPATTQMMYSNEEVMDAVEHRITETFDKRLEHEISRILNGWGM